MSEFLDYKIETDIHFSAVNKLYKHFDEYLEDHSFPVIENIMFCPYEIVSDGKYPFLKYLFCKDFEFSYFNNEIIKFIDIENISVTDINKALSNSRDYIYSYLNSTISNFKLESDFYKTKRQSLVKENIINEGFKIYGKNIYIFFDITKCKLNIDDINRNSVLWFATSSEILNLRNILGFKISIDITDFFRMNNEFCFLYDNNNNTYSLPSVYYVIKPENKTAFTYMFGVSTTNNIFGNCYYFTSYENALNQLKSEEYINTKKVGLIRVGLFLDKTKLVQNLLSDENDNSEIKNERLNDTTLDRNFEFLTTRISDYDGLWRENYDSIMINNIRLDDGTFMKNTPIICVKSYEQQYPLSYHYVNLQNIDEKTSININ